MKKMKDTRLTKSEVQKLFQISKNKYDEIWKDTKAVYQEATATEGQEAVLNNTASKIEQSVDEKRDKILKEEAYIGGWSNKDPYFILNFRAISPVCYEYYTKGTTTYQIKNSYNSEKINARIREIIGEENLKEFLNIFNKKRSEYYGRLGDISKKFKTLGGSAWEGIPKGVIQDWLAKIRKYSINPKEVEILSVILDLQSASINEVAKETDYSYQTVRKKVNKEMIKKYTKNQKKGRKKVYWIKDDKKQEVENMVDEMPVVSHI